MSTTHHTAETGAAMVAISALATPTGPKLQTPPVDKAAWAAYRQALRDISKQSGFPWTVAWPVAP